ncbi:hypothetical protein BU17DRAFT_68025 [Hysterangium stoloniferum]|nr:hypothetical protein BU17DRAFT_68025 [Hysterangium stoloniferum]
MAYVTLLLQHYLQISPAIALVPPGIQAASRSRLQRAIGTHALTQQHENYSNLRSRQADIGWGPYSGVKSTSFDFTLDAIRSGRTYANGNNRPIIFLPSCLPLNIFINPIITITLQFAKMAIMSLVERFLSWGNEPLKPDTVKALRERFLSQSTLSTFVAGVQATTLGNSFLLQGKPTTLLVITNALFFTGIVFNVAAGFLSLAAATALIKKEQQSTLYHEVLMRSTWDQLNKVLYSRSNSETTTPMAKWLHREAFYLYIVKAPQTPLFLRQAAAEDVYAYANASTKAACALVTAIHASTATEQSHAAAETAKSKAAAAAAKPITEVHYSAANAARVAATAARASATAARAAAASHATAADAHETAANHAVDAYNAIAARDTTATRDITATHVAAVVPDHNTAAAAAQRAAAAHDAAAVAHDTAATTYTAEIVKSQATAAKPTTEAHYSAATVAREAANAARDAANAARDAANAAHDAAAAHDADTAHDAAKHAAAAYHTATTAHDTAATAHKTAATAYDTAELVKSEATAAAAKPITEVHYSVANAARDAANAARDAANAARDAAKAARDAAAAHDAVAPYRHDDAVAVTVVSVAHSAAAAAAAFADNNAAAAAARHAAAAHDTAATAHDTAATAYDTAATAHDTAAAHGTAIADVAAVHASDIAAARASDVAAAHASDARASATTHTSAAQITNKMLPADTKAEEARAAEKAWEDLGMKPAKFLSTADILGTRLSMWLMVGAVAAVFTIVGIICFFISIVCLTIDAQANGVWIATVAVLVVMTSLGYSILNYRRRQH